MNIFLTIIITLVIYFVLTYLLKKICEIATKNNKDKTLSKIIAVISWVLIIGVIISPLLL